MRFSLITVALFLALPAQSGWAFQESPLFQFEISKETTYVTAPVTDDGFVDLAEAINLHHSRGVTPETNMAIVLYEALGPNPDQVSQSDEFFERMGMAKPATDGEYFQDFKRFYEDDADQLEMRSHHFKESISRPWTRNEFPAVSEWLESQEKFLKRISEGVHRKHYFSPVLDNGDGSGRGQRLTWYLLPGVQASRYVGRALVARSMLHLGEGRTNEAWQDLVTSFRLGRHVGSGSFYLEGLVGIAIERTAASGIVSLIQSSQLDEKTSLRYLHQLEELPPPSKMSDKFNFGERLNFIDFVSMVSDGEENREEVFEYEERLASMRTVYPYCDYNETLRVSNRWFDRYVKAIRIKSPVLRKPVMDHIESELCKIRAKFTSGEFIWEVFLTENESLFLGRVVGQAMVYTLLPDFALAQSAEDQILQWDTNLRIALALEAYHAKHKNYPETLDELSPAYLKMIPLDVFSDEPLRYSTSPSGYTLYSIGLNQVDDQGVGYDNGADDVVISKSLKSR